MAYVAVSGGEEAIAASLALLREELDSCAERPDAVAITAAFPELVDQAMGEASLYDPTLAALALRQGGGSVEEAVFLLRAFRSTLERPYVSRVIETGAMRVRRRISAAFKDIAGGQILGASRDYSHRLLDFESLEPAVDEVLCIPQCHPERRAKPVAEAPAAPAAPPPLSAGGFDDLPKVRSYLEAQGLLPVVDGDDTPPRDVTMEPLSFPAERSVRLQTLARGMTQAVMAFGYAAIRGFGPAHPTVGELRQGSVAIHIDHPLEKGDEADAYYVGSLVVTEVESLFSVEQPPERGSAGVESVEGEAGTTGTTDEHSLEFGIGYGLVYGCAESKAIAMSVLDYCLALGDASFPTQDEEFVLSHVDGIEATGFISHLKLPHYVTFQSKLDSVRRTRDTPASAPTSENTSPMSPCHPERRAKPAVEGSLSATADNHSKTPTSENGVNGAPSL
jgi:alpha-D-ribose 1-methylphosphonate 5-triphosphate synthase subunit PhnI